MKAVLFTIFLLGLLGSIGACDAGNISMLQCFVQGAICILGTYVVLRWRAEK